MSSASIKKIIPCKKDQLIKMVLDIEKYPEFVPWCIDGKIINKKESEDILVVYYKEKDLISVTNIEGPLKHLTNEWKFKEINGATQLVFEIDFELKNNFLNAIMKRSFNFGLNKIADSFEKRAKDLFK